MAFRNGFTNGFMVSQEVQRQLRPEPFSKFAAGCPLPQ
jgi:hypothetical protein